MLPVGTPPNAIVFASGTVTIQQMARGGAVLNCHRRPADHRVRVAARRLGARPAVLTHGVRSRIGPARSARRRSRAPSVTAGHAVAPSLTTSFDDVPGRASRAAESAIPGVVARRLCRQG
jgi:hypothetical protein